MPHLEDFVRGDWPWPSRPPVDGLRSAKASGNARKVKVQAASLLCNGQQLCRNGTHLGSASAAGVLVPQPIFLLSHCGCTAESRGLVPALVQKCPKRKRAPSSCFTWSEFPTLPNDSPHILTSFQVECASG